MGAAAAPLFATLGAYATGAVGVELLQILFVNVILSGHSFVDEDGYRWVVSEDQ